MELKNSKFAHLLRTQNGMFCLSQALTQQQIYGDHRLRGIYEHFLSRRSVNSFKQAFRDAFPQECSEGILSVLQKNFFLTNKTGEDFPDYVAPEETKRDQGYRLLRVLLTDVCNLACSYCKVMPNIADVTKRATSNEDLERVIRIFFEGSKANKPKIIHISGGEPLIRWDSIVYIIHLVETYRRSNERYFIVIGTNGILLDEGRVRFLANHNVKAIVSLDGREKIHDILRQDHGGKGSYRKVVDGIRLLNMHGIELGLSMVIGRHNVGKLTKEIGFLVNEFNPTSLGGEFYEATHTRPARLPISHHAAGVCGRHV